MYQDWDFKTANTKEYTHCFHRYPAMMIPQIARRLLQEYGNGATTLFDPYCGTGTSLVEANLHGITAIGTDLNPLARLISQTKTMSIPIQSLDLYLKDFNDYTFKLGFTNTRLHVEIPQFKNIDYWFAQDVQRHLALIKIYIDQIEDNHVQNFFKVAFSETVRESSWTRNSEFKLYRMTEKQRSRFNPDVFGMMIVKLARNRNGLHDFLQHRKQLVQSHVMAFNTVEAIPKNMVNHVDIVVTSPPYGDSKTTVAYGQFSRLSNQWLCFEGANQVDNQLMGGKRKRNTCHEKSKIYGLKKEMSLILSHDKKRADEVMAFFDDYALSVDHVSQTLKLNGYVCYVVGNRTVKGVTLPMHHVTQTLFERKGFTHVCTIPRNIPNKRMPSKNSPSNISGQLGKTMSKENIVILKR